jgi:hypothetical protein
LLGAKTVLAKAILFDAQKVRLLVFTGSGLLSMNTFSWTEAGSFVLLLNFMHRRAEDEPQWLRALVNASTIFTERHLLSQQPTYSFLGQGGTGRVFQVCLANGGTAALKVVDSEKENVLALVNEVSRLRSLRMSKQGSHVLQLLPEPLTEDACVLPNHLGAAALFHPVGSSLEAADRSLSLWVEVCGSLGALHTAGIMHGDPRLPNIIRVNDALVWIDCRLCPEKVPDGFMQLDFVALIRSFASCQNHGQFDHLADCYAEIIRNGGEWRKNLTQWCNKHYSKTFRNLGAAANHIY